MKAAVQPREYETMNRIQQISQKIESERLKLQMGLNPDIEIDTLLLRGMWRQLCREREAEEIPGGLVTAQAVD
jgi:hypothetical protein